MPKLIMMVGNIGSGKSTLVKHLTSKGYIAISMDALRYMVGGGEYLFDEDLEPSIFRIEKHALRELSDSGYDIILDETNVSLAIREHHRACVEEKGYEIIAIVMPRLSKETSVKRRMQQSHGYDGPEVWGEVWERFDKKYVEPTIAEGFNKIIHHKGDTIETVRTVEGK